MNSCPLYSKDGNINSNSNNIGKYNPYGMIQNGGKRKLRRTKTILKRYNKKRGKGRKTRKYRR